MSLKTKFDGLAACLRFDNALQLVLARLLFRKSRFVSHRLGEIQFVADQFGGDECGLRPCLAEAMYDTFLSALGISQISPPLDIADIGANAGGFSLIFAARKIPVRKVLAVEMNPLTYSRLRLNLLTNYGPVAVPVNAGAASGATPVKVFEAIIDTRCDVVTLYKTYEVLAVGVWAPSRTIAMVSSLRLCFSPC
jgi:hypothetical protein